MHPYIFLLTLVICNLYSAFAQDNPLESEKWKTFFAERSYEGKSLQITDETFWTVADSYAYHTNYPLLLIYADGSAREIALQYEGLHSLIFKKMPLLTGEFERIGKENVAYMVFDGFLLKNPLIGSMIAGDFMIVCKKGPLSLYREYYTSPIERDNIQSVLTPYYLSEPVSNFYLGSFARKTARLLDDCPALAEKIKDELPGYSAGEEDFLKIASEYNAWVKENYPYRHADHIAMFWETPVY